MLTLAGRMAQLGTESAFDRLQIWPMSVARKLHAVAKALSKIVDENLSRFAVAAANVEGRNQLRVGVQPNPRPDITSAFRGLFRGRQVLLFRVAKCPCLIDLYVLTWKVHEHAVLIFRERLPGILQELLQRGLYHYQKMPNFETRLKDVSHAAWLIWTANGLRLDDFEWSKLPNQRRTRRTMPMSRAFPIRIG